MSRTTETSANPTISRPSGFTETSEVKFLLSLRAIGITLFPPRVVLFLALFAWYLYARMDLRLVFQARDKLFLWNLRFFTDFIGQPGSLLEWMDSLYVQLCYYGWPSAIVLTAAAWLILVSTIGFMNASGRAHIGGTWVIPGILLMVLYSHYFFHSSVIVGLALVMTAANGWVRMPVWRPWLRLALFVTISIALYYVTGGAYYCFVACCVVNEMLAEKRWLSGVFFLLAAVGVKFGLDAALAHLNLESMNFLGPSFDEYLNTPLDWRVALLYCYFPACLLFLIFRQTAGNSAKTLLQQLRKFIGNNPPPQHEMAVRSTDAGASTGTSGRLQWVVKTAIVLYLAAAIGNHVLYRELKLLLEIDYCAEHRLWNDILVKVKKLPTWRYYHTVNLDVNLALYHTGRMPNQLFSHPQIYLPVYIPQLYPDQVTNVVMMRKLCDLFLELGRVNEAEPLAFDIMETWPTGSVLKRLALIKMIKGQTAAASVFLKVLRDDLVWDRWAEGYLQRLETDPHLAGDEDIQRIRRLMILEDDFSKVNQSYADGEVGPVIPALLLKSLEYNPQNRMAFEYLMATHLVTGNLHGVVESLSFLDNFPYPAIPTLYEEAILIYGVKHPENVELKESGGFFRGRKISKTTMNNYRRFLEIVKFNGGPNEQAESAMARELGGSYFYYYYYAIKKQRS